jgi:hypothetical protein
MNAETTAAVAAHRPRALDTDERAELERYRAWMPEIVRV